jgi:hypothetical protein
VGILLNTKKKISILVSLLARRRKNNRVGITQMCFGASIVKWTEILPQGRNRNTHSPSKCNGSGGWHNF